MIIEQTINGKVTKVTIDEKELYNKITTPNKIDFVDFCNKTTLHKLPEKYYDCIRRRSIRMVISESYEYNKNKL